MIFYDEPLVADTDLTPLQENNSFVENGIRPQYAGIVQWKHSVHLNDI